MKEEQKARLEALADRTVQWGKQTFTPRRIKKAVGVVLVLAVAGAGGKFALHRVKGAARLQEAQALGTTPDAVNFRSVILADKGSKEFQGPKEKDKGFKQDRKDDDKHRDKKENRDERKETGSAPRDQENRQLPPEGPQHSRQPMPAAQGQPSAVPAAPQVPAIPPMAAAPRGNQFPAFYLADCEMDGMRYHFVIDAQSGKILRSQVHKVGPLDGFLA